MFSYSEGYTFMQNITLPELMHRKSSKRLLLIKEEMPHFSFQEDKELQ